MVFIVRRGRRPDSEIIHCPGTKDNGKKVGPEKPLNGGRSGGNRLLWKNAERFHERNAF